MEVEVGDVKAVSTSGRIADKYQRHSDRGEFIFLRDLNLTVP